MSNIFYTKSIISTERKIVTLVLSNGKAPFEIWRSKLSMLLQRAVDARLTRLSVGSFGDHKSVGGGVFELRIPKGPGLRIYYGMRSFELVVLIGGGDKSTQKKDIQKAKILWRQYNEN
jgi:putative addiction module killer protein